jgi:hypothetical protein
MDFTHVGELPPKEKEKHCHELSTRPIGRWFPTKVVSYSSSAQLLVLAKIGGDGLSMVSQKDTAKSPWQNDSLRCNRSVRSINWKNTLNVQSAKHSCGRMRVMPCVQFVIRFENGSTRPTLNHTAALTLFSLRSAHRNGGITL